MKTAIESNMKKAKVCIAERHFIHRLGVKTILSVIGIEPDLFEVNSVDSTLKCLQENRDIDFIIFDHDIFNKIENKAIRKIRLQCPCTRFLVLSDDKKYSDSHVSYISQDDSRQEILDKFQSFFYEQNKDINDSENSALLSEREVDVLKNVALGYANKEIADKLYISINTVISHRKNITEKLGIKTIAGLTVYAVMHGLIKPEEVKV